MLGEAIAAAVGLLYLVYSIMMVEIWICRIRELMKDDDDEKTSA